MRDHQHRPFVSVYQLTQTRQIPEIQERIRLIEDQQIRRQQHFPHYLQQLVLPAAYLVQLRIRKPAHAGRSQLLRYIAFIIIAVHSLVPVEKLLILCIRSLKILRLRHLLADRRDLFLQLREPLAQILEHRSVTQLVAYAELTGIPDAAVFIHDDLSVIQIPLRIGQDLHQRGFSRAVAADQRAVLPRFQRERNIFI